METINRSQTHFKTPFSYGAADSYYRRPRRPRYRNEHGAEITDLNETEKQEYYNGYQYNESLGDYKEWY